MNTPGRIQRKLIRLLEAEGFAQVKLIAAQGRYRSDIREDCYRWTGSAQAGTYAPLASVPKLGVSFSSWYTMTACCKAGIVIDEDGGTTILLVSAKEPPCTSI